MADKKTAKRFVCIHGHFYQPYRKNPWIEEIDIQKDAYPYKDWNERINAECYRANAFARVLGNDNKLADIYNNYSKISFNFGPTLLEWIKTNDLTTYERIIEGDFQSRNIFSGHGTAIAQNYNHLIMPLASRQDKILQIYWAIYDFEKNFSRNPEGMWLAETAVDYETLEILADFGIKYTILSPYQASRYRQSLKNPDKDLSGENQYSDKWILAEEGSIDTRRPYTCVLPSGREISVFFYDRELSTALSFGDLLKNGEGFAQSIINAPYSDKDRKEIIIIASDGEAYGHHKKFGDMALAYCIKTIQEDCDVAFTVFGEYLELFPPDFEVEIIENTAWSCSHFLSRWEGGCSCGMPENQPEGKWSQEWRVHLRQAINKARAEIDKIYQSNIKEYIKEEAKDDLQILKDYIIVADKRNPENIRIFLNKYSNKNMRNITESAGIFNLIKNDYAADEGLLLALLEMQRQAMLMQSSDAWFFDDISRIEVIQIFTHVLMAIKLGSFFDLKKARKIEEIFIDILKSAKCNIPEGTSGSDIYLNEAYKKEYSTEKIVADFITDFLAAHNLKDNPDLYNNDAIFDFYNHEFVLTQTFDFEDEMLSGQSGGLYIISKTTLKKEFCLFFFLTGKNTDLQKGKHNEILKILIRKKTAGNKNNFKYSPETIFFNEIIKYNFRGNNTEEVFYKFKRKPGFKYYDLKDISERIKIRFLERYSLIKINELYRGLSGYKLYADSIEENMKKWVGAYFMDDNDGSIFNAIKKIRALIILNNHNINEKAIEELEYLADAEDSAILSENKNTGYTDFSFLKASAENLLKTMMNKYINDITDLEMLKIIIRLLKIYGRFKLNIDFPGLQDIVFKIKTIFDNLLHNKKKYLNEEIHNGVIFLLDFFNIEHLSDNEAF